MRKETINPTFFESLVEKMSNHPNKIAIIEDEGEVTTFGWILKEVRKQEILLKSLIKKGQPIGLVGPCSKEFIVLLLTIIKLEAVYFPINNDLPLSEQKKLVDLVQPQVILTTTKTLQDHYSVIFPQTICVSIGGSIKETGFDPVLTNVLPNDALYLIPTSGSKGDSKIVVGCKEGTLNRLSWYQDAFPFSENAVVCQKTSLSFVDHIAEILQPLFSGISFVILKPGKIKSLPEFLVAIQKYQVTHVTLVPSYLEMFTKIPREWRSKLDSLEMIHSSGEALSKELAEKIFILMPQVRLLNIYGASEISADVTYYEYHGHHLERALSFFSTISENTSEVKSLNLQGSFDFFQDADIPNLGMSEEEFFSYFSEKIQPNQVQVGRKSYLGHMTSPIPSYHSSLGKEIIRMNQNLVKVETSGGLTFLERQTIAKLHKFFYQFSGDFYEKHIQETSSTLGVCLNGGTLSNIQAIHLAQFVSLERQGIDSRRYSELGFQGLLKKMGYKRSVILGSPLMHYSFRKAISLFGMSENDLITIKLDSEGRCCLKDLEKNISHAFFNKWFVFCVVGIAGATETGVVDPLEGIYQLCQKYNLYFHVDASWGGGLFFSPDFKHYMRGIQFADSIAICGHKALYTPIGLSILLYKDPKMASLNFFHSRYQCREDSYDLGKATLIGTKPANFLYLEANLKILGSSGYRALIDKNQQNANLFSTLLHESKSFVLLGRPQSNIVVYRYIPDHLRDLTDFTETEEKEISIYNRKLQKEMFRANAPFVSYTEKPSYINPQKKIGILRAVFCNPQTDLDDVIELFHAHLDKLEKEIALTDRIKNIHQNLRRSKYIPIGKPISNAHLQIIGETGLVCKKGEMGQIQVKGSPVALGYLKNKNRKYQIIPFDPDGGYFTGDYAIQGMDDTLHYFGRKDDVIKLNGMRLNLKEIEIEIKNKSFVKNAVVFMQEVNGKKILFIFCLYEKSISLKLSSQDVYQLTGNLFLPFEIVEIDEVPFLPSGKVSQKKLMQKYFEKQDSLGISANSTKFDLNNLENQSDLLEIVRSVLGKPLSTHMNFFDAGFDSILLNELFFVLNSKYKLPITIQHLYQYPNVHSLYSYINDEHKSYAVNKSKKQTFLHLRKTKTDNFSNN